MTKSATCTLRNRNILLHGQLYTNVLSETSALGNTLYNIIVSTLYFSMNISLSYKILTQILMDKKVNLLSFLLMN